LGVPPRPTRGFRLPGGKSSPCFGFPQPETVFFGTAVLFATASVRIVWVMIRGPLGSWQVLPRRWVAPRRVGALTLQSGWCPQNSEEHTVTVILFYVAFMIGGDLAAYFLRLLVEDQWGKQVSLLVFLAPYFLFLLVSWLLAVWVTTPRVASSSAR